MCKLLSLLLCLFLLMGCAAPAALAEAPTAMEAFPATPIPTPDVTPSTAFTPRPTAFESMPTPTIDPAIWSL